MLTHRVVNFCTV